MISPHSLAERSTFLQELIQSGLMAHNFSPIMRSPSQDTGTNLILTTSFPHNSFLNPWTVIWTTGNNLKETFPNRNTWCTSCEEDCYISSMISSSFHSFFSYSLWWSIYYIVILRVYVFIYYLILFERSKIKNTVLRFKFYLLV